jgi:hypothetical protein
MVWLALSAPLMILAVLIAAVPVLVGSVRERRLDDAHQVRSTAAPHAAAAPPASSPAEQIGVHCPLCARQIRAATVEVLDGMVERHAWTTHGIPSASQIVESAQAA